MAFEVELLSTMGYSLTTLSITIFSKMTFRIMTRNKIPLTTTIIGKMIINTMLLFIMTFSKN